KLARHPSQTGTVGNAGLQSRKPAKGNSLYDKRNENRVIANNPDPEIRSVMCLKVCIRDAPSTREASSISTGIVRRCRTRYQIENGRVRTVSMSITAPRLFRTPSD